MYVREMCVCVNVKNTSKLAGTAERVLPTCQPLISGAKRCASDRAVAPASK